MSELPSVNTVEKNSFIRLPHCAGSLSTSLSLVKDIKMSLYFS